MPVSPENYDHRGADNYGIVVRCPNIVGDRLVYFDRSAVRGSWVIRDFITGKRLENNDSHLSVAQIEADADYDECPPRYNADNFGEWEAYLTMRTSTVFGTGTAGVSKVAPNPASGAWRGL